MKNFLNNWHFMRFAQLAFGIVSVLQALDSKQWFFLIFAVFFFYKAIFNIGCHNNNCEISNKN